jgi:hypothetical protein
MSIHASVQGRAIHRQQQLQALRSYYLSNTYRYKKVNALTDKASHSLRTPESDECSRQWVLLRLPVRIHQLLLQQLQPSQQHITRITLAGNLVTPTAPAAAAAAAAAVTAMLAAAAVSDSCLGIATAADAVGNSTAAAAAPCLAGVLLFTVCVSGASIWLLV